jgi:hypothetical protein
LISADSSSVPPKLKSLMVARVDSCNDGRWRYSVKSPVAWRKVGGVELEILVLREALWRKMRSESEAGRSENE